MKLPVHVVAAALALTAVAPRAAAEGGTSAARVDPGWLERAQRHDTATSAAPLVTEFALAHPSSLMKPGAPLDGWARVRVISADLDGDPEPEQLLFIGPNPAQTMFYVIDRRGDSWSIAYEGSVDLHNEEPEVHVSEGPSSSRVFYFRALVEHTHSSDSWLYTWRFFRLIGGRVYRALEVVERSELHLAAYELRQHAETTVRPEAGGLRIEFRYRFSPGQRILVDLGILRDYTDDRDVKLVADEGSVIYRWDARRNRLVPSFDGTRLSAEKVSCFTDLGNADRFARAFRPELIELARKGSPEQKKAADYFLRKLSTRSHARTGR